MNVHGERDSIRVYPVPFTTSVPNEEGSRSRTQAREYSAPNPTPSFPEGRLRRTENAQRYVLKTLRAEIGFERFVVDYNGKVKSLNTHLRAKVQALSDIVEGTLKTLIAAVQLIGGLVLRLLATPFELIKSGNGEKILCFLGERMSPLMRLNVLKAVGLGTAYSVYSFASPQRAINSGINNKHIGTSLRSNDPENFGTPYNPQTKTSNWALSSNFWAWGGRYLKA